MVLRAARPTLIFSEPPCYDTPFHSDPWPLSTGSSSPRAHDESSFASSSSSSRRSSTYSHVAPESVFLNTGIDPFCGLTEIALPCAEYIRKTFHSAEETEASRRLGQPKLSVFVAQIMHITGAPPKVLAGALIILQRFHSAQPPAARARAYSGHKLFLGALMLASADETLQGMVANAQSAAYWSGISLFSEAELGDIFVDIYDALEGNVVVFPSYAAALEKLNKPVNIQSFEGDLRFVEEQDDWYESEASDSSTSSIDMAPPPVKKKNKKGHVQKPLETFVRTKIATLFGRRTRSS